MSQNIYFQTQTELFTKTHSLNVMKMLPKLLPELSVDMPLNVVEHSFEKLHSEVLLCKKIVTCDVVTLRPLIMYRDKCFSCFNLHILLTWTFHHMPYFAVLRKQPGAHQSLHLDDDVPLALLLSRQSG
ncbi:hypothetical protein T4A_8647 [Trichinella pseudospiralis]|uniref:Uncharacterized protein n=1 Tax=Trichinella pseudospiralis TaxID=6337 RepID=A0A0V1E8W9_TRIPS|nr:hypothetical protein T4A_1976 [Trichinella pseudospiralis]KRY70295.1 hypothetical protein T4A_5742 [Trichinella pseudospiralis]KRY76949.1 hypothetical protein T4A_8647 [Trichinella pseudospiralis]